MKGHTVDPLVHKSTCTQHSGTVMRVHASTSMDIFVYVPCVVTMCDIETVTPGLQEARLW